MTQRKPYVLSRRSVITEPKPIPCPRCYAKCVLVGKHWSCSKHGRRYMDT